MNKINSIEQMLVAKCDSISSEQDDVELEEESALSNPDVTQMVTRTVDQDSDTIVGHFRCTFESGQQRYVLNYPIHPAFETAPRIESASALEEVDLRIRVTECRAYGVRLELILSQPASAKTTVLVELIVSASHCHIQS